MSNYLKSVIFALTTAVVCSFLLTAAAAGLKKFQLENVEVDQKKNILKAVGLVESDTAYSKEQIKTIYQDNIRSFYVTTDGVVMEKDDRVEKSLPIYVYAKQDQIESYIIPINTRGLWGKILGYVALKNDGSTIAGFTVYKHSETPGLGGEIEKRWFQKNFEGKKVIDRMGNFVSIAIAKGALTESFPEAKRHNYVDGIMILILIAFFVGKSKWNMSICYKDADTITRQIWRRQKNDCCSYH